MTLSLTTSARNAAADAIVALANGGTLELQTSGGVEVATLTLGSPAFGAAVAGVATANAITRDNAATGGTATQFVVKSSGGAALFSGSVGTTGTDMLLSSNVFAVNDAAEISSFTFTMPAS